ncbi:hypothetical protein [Tomitella fengzijianii]|uniref:Uncharacterized protein n=1 Tax=Tomitella fengzijianii TaxID=2597660 RepID=A0A516X660_9ACTN|nr:hypothetical protein [Tomitella fengzijianii]QDQ98562.1 hypothetical protein FO059_16080 [Tomitella fengzijianii]
MDALTDLLQTSTTLWAAGLIGIVVGLIVGVLLGLVLGRRRRRADRRAAGHGKTRSTNPGADVTGATVRFIDAADTAHNALLAVDQKELADTELEDALQSGQPAMRRLAESIMTLAGIHNELRVRAPKAVLDAAESVFTHVTYSAMDGVADGEAFSATYQERKTALVDAARAEVRA